jgi:hypothetical protein
MMIKELIRSMKEDIKLKLQRDERQQSLVVHNSKLQIYCDFIAKRYGLSPKPDSILKTLDAYINIDRHDKVFEAAAKK